jgi:hypothetical protein
MRAVEDEAPRTAPGMVPIPAKEVHRRPRRDDIQLVSGRHRGVEPDGPSPPRGREHAHQNVDLQDRPARVMPASSAASGCHRTRRVPPEPSARRQQVITGSRRSRMIRNVSRWERPPVRLLGHRLAFAGRLAGSPRRRRRADEDLGYRPVGSHTPPLSAAAGQQRNDRCSRRCQRRSVSLRSSGAPRL